MREVLVALISLGGIGLFFGVVLAFLDKKLKVEVDPTIEKVTRMLPGLNCGACGFAGCDVFAQRVVKAKDLFGGCLPGGKELNKEIASSLGIESSFKSTPFKVVVFCGARFGEKKTSFEYRGPQKCSYAQLGLGTIDCRYGCLGLGDCVSVCPTKALYIEAGLVVVDYDKCIGCGKCVKVCPRNVLQLVEVERGAIYAVSCSNPANALGTKMVCSKGCIGCGICVRLVNDSPFYLTRGLSRLDRNKVKGTDKEKLELAKEKCPVKIILRFDVSESSDR